MYLPYNMNFKERARELRKNMTPEERKLWYMFLKNNKYRFLRQKILDNYIVDFYCPSKKIVIELDGSQHYTIDGLEYDKIRSDLLNAYNIKVLRYSNLEINQQFKIVCKSIESELNNNPLST